MLMAKNNANNDLNNNSNTTTNETDTGSDHVGNGITSAASTAKYQLRPRSIQSRRFCDTEWPFPDTTVRHKTRASPLSRYRRKTANARERHRMRQINTAFESLRGVIPSWVCSRRAAADLTKITTLRLASAYIRALEDILKGNASEETHPWVLCNILESSSSPMSHPRDENQKVQIPTVTAIKSPLRPFTSQESDIVSLLCSSPSATALEDNNLEFPYLTSECDDMTYFVGCDLPKNWQNQQQQTSLVT